MPSKTPAQARLMAAAAHDPKFAKKVGVPQDVAKDFNQADAGTGIIQPKEAVERIVAGLLRESSVAQAQPGFSSLWDETATDAFLELVASSPIMSSTVKERGTFTPQSAQQLGNTLFRNGRVGDYSLRDVDWLVVSTEWNAGE